jgi:hypothetical protein
MNYIGGSEMEQLKWRQIALLFSPVIIISALLFILLHLSPTIAIRTHIFMDGHPIAAFKTDIKENKGYYDMTEFPKDQSTGGPYLGHFTVSKHGFIYFAHNAGFA